VDRLDDDAAIPFGLSKREQRRDHRTVAVSPQHAPLDAQHVEELLGLDRGGDVELRRQLSDVWRPAIARAVRDHEPAIERRDRVVMRIEAVPPSAVQEHDRRAFAVSAAPPVSVVELDRPRAWEQR